MPLTRRLALSALLGGAAVAADPAAAKLPNKIPAKPASRALTRAPAGRDAFAADDQAQATVAGNADLRFFADAAEPFRAALSGLDASLPWLAFSTGGENGAFGAGLLNGWTAAGTRPTFGLVTGISTGALTAPFAFAGPDFDGRLREAFTEVTAADIFEIGATPESYFDTWPLTKLIARHTTPDLLAAIAAGHREGRRLFIVTTNLDAGRPVAWNMGLIAEQGGADALKLFRAVLLASASIPGLFPPVYVEAAAGGRAIREMHVDGGVMAPFFLAPEAILAAGSALPTRRAYVVVHNTLRPDFAVTEGATLPILGRALNAAVRAGTRAALAVHETYARRTGLDLQVAAIGPRFDAVARGAFDQGYMRALFAHGAETARQGTAFNPRLSTERVTQR